MAFGKGRILDVSPRTFGSCACTLVKRPQQPIHLDLISLPPRRAHLGSCQLAIMLQPCSNAQALFCLELSVANPSFFFWSFACTEGWRSRRIVGALQRLQRYDKIERDGAAVAAPKWVQEFAV